MTPLQRLAADFASEEGMSIPFMQFLLPDGRPKCVVIDRPEEIEAMARSLIEYGCRFEIEMLRDGTINMEVIRDEECVVGRMCGNGPEVPDSVDAMMREAFEAMRNEASQVIAEAEGNV